MKESISAELLAAARQKNDIAISTIIAQEMPTILHFASGAARPGLDFDDAVQEGLIGLFKAIQSYETNRNASFSTYASTCVQNAIISAQRMAGRKKHSPLNQSVPLPEDRATPGPEEQTIANEDVQLTLKKIQTDLSSFERNVLLLHLEDYSYKEIAEKLGKSPKAIENALQRLRRKLR